MVGEIFQLSAILFALGFAAIAFLIALIVGAVQGEGSDALARGAEAGVLALVGGLVARSFIGGLLALGGGEGGAGLAVGWFFFLWPGAIDTVAAIFGAQLLTGTGTLLWIALVVGSLAGFFDGLWRIHRWRGPGVVTFLVDVTWGLAGTTQGILFHLFNFSWAGHAGERRRGAHRYRKGFRFKSGFAVTQGSVMSNMGSEGPGTALYAHERMHVLQNRIFGPFFTLTYLGWMVIMFIPGLIAGASSGEGAGPGVEKLCYFNNPWEAWAYGVGQSHGGPARSSWGKLIWSDLAVGLVSVPFYAVAIGLVTLTVALSWF